MVTYTVKMYKISEQNQQREHTTLYKLPYSGLIYSAKKQ